MRHPRLVRWVVVLSALVAPATVSATEAETDTITITGTFKMDGVWGGNADLDGVYANGNEHTWTATLHGVTHEHWRTDPWTSTAVYATSFEFQFSGPDAATLNAVVGDRLGGSGAVLRLDNYNDSTGTAAIGFWDLFLPSADPDAGVGFSTGDQSVSHVGFPADADGYPVLPSWLNAIESYVYASDGYAGLVSYYDALGVTGDIGTALPATLSIGDAVIAEGHRGSGQLALWVTLSNTSDQAVTVDYRTVDGTAISVGGKRTKADYGAASGTITFQPGETWKAITVSINGDRAREAHETFFVELFNAVGVPVEDGVATVTIVNDD